MTYSNIDITITPDEYYREMKKYFTFFLELLKPIIGSGKRSEHTEKQREIIEGKPVHVTMQESEQITEKREEFPAPKPERVQKKLSKNEQEYVFVCELLWGCIPDRAWAEKTELFIQESPKILNRYPKLDISFFESR